MAIITLAEFKTFIGVSDDSQDATLQVYVDAADTYVKQFLDRDIEVTDYTDVLMDGSGTPCLIVDQYPIVSVTAIYENDEWVSVLEDPNDSTNTSSGYYLKSNRPYGIFHDICWAGGRDVIKISYTGGYETLPDDLKTATLMVANYFKNMSTNQGIRGESLGSYSYSLASDVNAGGGRFIIPDMAIMTILSKYKRIFVGDPVV